MRDHHRLLLRQILKHMAYIEEMVEELDREIWQKLQPYDEDVKLACSVPGIGRDAAASILAEIGTDMSEDGPLSRLPSVSLLVRNLSWEQRKRWQAKEWPNAKGESLAASDFGSNSMGWNSEEKLLIPGSLSEIETAAWSPTRRNCRLACSTHRDLLGASQSRAVSRTGATPLDNRRRDVMIQHHLKRLKELGYTA